MFKDIYTAELSNSMYLNVTLWTLNMVCRKFKIYIFRHFHVDVAMKPFRIMNEAKSRIPIYMI